jgi:cellulose synthase operon protein YhjQ
MKTIAIVSLKGGVGKTTTAANLGAALARRDRAGVLLVDLDPRNQLGFHIGLAGDSAGFAEASLRGIGWERVVQRSVDGVSCLPYGTHRDGLAAEFDALLARSPNLLSDGLADLSLQGHGLAVVDTAPWPSPLLDQALALADLMIFVLTADPASFATLPVLPSLLRRRRSKNGDERTGVLLNCIDGSRLSHDVRALVTALPELPLLQFAIHRDAAVPEALALQRPVLMASPGSQAADDFERLAGWVLEELAAGNGHRPPLGKGSEPITFPEVPSVTGAHR